jgi:hypothetical protein
MQHNRHSRASTDENMLLFSVRDRLSEDSKPDITNTTHRASSISSTESMSKKTGNELFDEGDFDTFSEDATVVQAAQQSPFVPPSTLSSKRSVDHDHLRRQGMNLFWILAWYVFSLFRGYGSLTYPIACSLVLNSIPRYLVCYLAAARLVF